MNVHASLQATVCREFCTGYGQSDTHALVLSDGRDNPHPSKGTEYATITAKGIVEMVRNPPCVPKEKAQWFIPSIYAGHDGREHSVQRERGSFLWLCADIDSGNPQLEYVRAALDAVLGDVSYLVYSTSGATSDCRKWRVLIPLKSPVRGADYGDTQATMFDMLAEHGVECDRALERPGQLVYLPNRGAHYEWHVQKRKRLDLADHPIAQRRDRERTLRAEAEAEAKAHRRRKAEDRKARMIATPDHQSPVDHFNSVHPVAEMLSRYGYSQKGASDNWRSPMQGSKTYATRNYGDFWISLSGSDAAAEIGAPTKNGYRHGDAFDLFAHFDHGGDFNAAVQAYAEEAGLSRFGDSGDLAGPTPADTDPPPDGFKLAKDGIRRKIEDKEGNVEWRWLCTPIRVLALPRGPDGKGWGRLVEIKNADGQWKRWSVPAELFAGDGLEVRREALNLGLDMDCSSQGRIAFSSLLQRWRPKARATTTERLGWTDDGCTAFILGNGEAIGGQNVVFQSEHLRSTSAEMHSKGTLQDWVETVGKRCVGNPMAIMAESLAFAGPLLEPMKHEGVGIHLRGESSRGKSTILRAAVSVWGAPGFVQSWRATSNGLEGVAATCNGTLVALDEMSEVSAKEAGGAVYMLANGVGKARASRAGTARPVARWRTAILSSGELSLADKMAEGGQRKRAGQDVRLIDIQADARAYGAFDDLHGEKDGAAFSERLSRAAAQAYGTAGPAFVHRILDDVNAATETARDISDGFVKDAVADLAPNADGQVRRVLKHIGMVVAAGEMATALGLTGWPEGEAARSGRVLARAWLNARGGSGAQETKDAIDRTRAFIVAHGDARFVDLEVIADERPRTINRAGWKQDGKYYVAKDVWVDIHRGANPDNAARALRDAGFLVTETDRLVMKAPRTDEGRPRCYCIKAEIMECGDD